MVTRKFQFIDRIFLFTLAILVFTTLGLYFLFWESAPVERLPKVAYIGNPLEAPEIWLAAIDGTGHQQLTHTQGKVYDFTVSPDGENLVYSARNESGGTDLYRIGRAESDVELLVSCGESFCVQPTWQRTGIKIAYSQYVKGIDADSNVHIFDLATMKPIEIPDGKQLSGAYPSFSPDGNFLAYHQFSNQSVHILDLTNWADRRIASSNPGYPGWLPEYGGLTITRSVMNGLYPQSRLYKVNLTSLEATPFLAERLTGYDASRIEWSPGGEWGVFGLKPVDSQAGRQMYIVRENGEDFQQVTTDAATSHAAYHWSPTGEQIVFQRYTAGITNATPEVVIWDLNTRAVTTISENGALPLWLP